MEISKAFDYNGTPEDCRPVGNQAVIEVVSGPNHYGQHTFFVYWNDESPVWDKNGKAQTQYYDPLPCVRGQIFVAHLAAFLERYTDYRFVDRRYSNL
jgi:hypothetical protein